MKNWISLQPLRKFAKNLISIIHGIPKAQERQENAKGAILEARAKILDAKASNDNIEAIRNFRKLLEEFGFSPEDINDKISKIITSDNVNNPIKDLNVISDLAKRGRISLQIPGNVEDKDDKDLEDDAQYA